MRNPNWLLKRNVQNLRFQNNKKLIKLWPLVENASEVSWWKINFGKLKTNWCEEEGRKKRCLWWALALNSELKRGWQGEEEILGLKWLHNTVRVCVMEHFLWCPTGAAGSLRGQRQKGQQNNIYRKCQLPGKSITFFTRAYRTQLELEHLTANYICFIILDEIEIACHVCLSI